MFMKNFSTFLNFKQKITGYYTYSYIENFYSFLHCGSVRQIFLKIGKTEPTKTLGNDFSAMTFCLLACNILIFGSTSLSYLTKLMAISRYLTIKFYPHKLTQRCTKTAASSLQTTGCVKGNSLLRNAFRFLINLKRLVSCISILALSNRSQFLISCFVCNFDWLYKSTKGR